MKKLIILVLALALTFVVSCGQITESLREPVDPKDTTPVEFEVKKGDNWGTVSGRLSEMKLVSNSSVVKSYVSEKKLSNKLQPGKYTLKKSMNLGQIIAELTKPTVKKETVKVTIPEGFETKMIAELLEKKKAIKSSKKFLKIVKEEKFDYDFLKDVDRKTYLEGYLFPDTYEFYKESDEREVAERLLSRFNEIYNDKYRARAKELNMTDKEVITLASIIQREARAMKEFPIVSSVFHNRIGKKMKLQACSTVQYVINERKDVLSNEDIKIESPYNTYKYAGLPPAPISSVGDAAIKAALYPEKTDYLYFVVQNMGDGSHYFAKTYNEHLNNIKKSQANLEKSKKEWFQEYQIIT